MGLSASQARLLSITQRINNNELQSELIANNKIMLSDANVAARDKYIAALDSKTFDYISYNDTGIQEAVAFTFNALNQYTPLKNQYSLYNTQGQLLVSEKDAQNFQKNDSLYRFLNEYGLFDRSGQEFEEIMAQYAKDMEDYHQKEKEYEEQLAKFNEDFAAYQTRLDAYNQRLEEYLEKVATYEKEMQAYQDALNTPKLYTEFTNAVVGNSHYNAAKGNDPGCFLHVLNNLLDYDGTIGGTRAPYNTSAKNPDGSPIQLTSLWENNYYNMPSLQNTSSYMSSKEDKYICDGNDVGAPAGKNLYEVDREAGRQPSVYTQLASDFIEIANGDGTFSYEKKTLRQKTIDMYYLIANSAEQKSTRHSGTGEFTITANGITVASFLENYVEGDMKGLDPKEPDPIPPLEPFEEDAPRFNGSLPTMPERPIPQVKIYDKPLAQWYINLWYAMDGQEKPDKINSVSDEQANFDYFIVDDKQKISTADKNGNQRNNFYQVIDNKLANDTEWLQFALTNGIVSMKQAALQTNGDIIWTGIEYSSTSDIKERDDESRIAKAEAEYKASLAKIQAEDKQYDLAIKKLDTEHSELIQEVESIKNVMGKNTERSFTTFS